MMNSLQPQKLHPVLQVIMAIGLIGELMDSLKPKPKPKDECPTSS
jgi:hypothetical protein